MKKRLDTIDKEITEIKKMMDDTYNIDRQISLSKCLVMLYELKKEVLRLNNIYKFLEELEERDNKPVTVYYYG